MDEIRRFANTDFRDGRLLKPGDQIYDLVDLIHKEDSDETQILKPTDGDGIIYDLIDIVEDDEEHRIINDKFHDEMMQRISAIAEKIAREVIPDIAERVIREEIEKLKKDL